MIDEKVARNTKILLYVFEGISVLTINIDKSEVIMIREDELKSNTYSELFNCAIESWPIKYLGVPISVEGLHIVDFLQLDERRSAIYRRKNDLDKSCFSSIALYCMSMYSKI
jgi:hypothetical protein